MLTPADVLAAVVPPAIVAAAALMRLAAAAFAAASLLPSAAPAPASAQYGASRDACQTGRSRFFANHSRYEETDFGSDIVSSA